MLGPTAGVPANSDKSRSATRRIAALRYTVGLTFLDEPGENLWRTLFKLWMKRS